MPERLSIEHCREIASQRRGLCLSEVYTNSKQKLTWQCLGGHAWCASLNNVKSKNSWCPKCDILNRLKKYNFVAPQKTRFENRKKDRVLQAKIIAEKVIKKTDGQVYMDELTFFNLRATKARFVDFQYGEWWTRPALVLAGHSHPLRGNEKRRQTCLRRFGVEFPTQDRETLLKGKKAARNSYSVIHWKTQELLVCVGTWEKKVAEYLNSKKIMFLWQHKSFTLPSGKTYRPDLYLVKENVWIEIKGWWRRQESKDKWGWFHKEYPNSELWNREKLKEMRIL